MANGVYNSSLTSTYIANATASYPNVSPQLATAIMNNESSGNLATGANSVGAIGLMQIKQSTANNLLSNPNLYDPQQNVNAGTALLSQLSTVYNGDTDKVAAAYALGQPTIDKAIAQATAAGEPNNWLAYAAQLQTRGNDVVGYVDKVNNQMGLPSQPATPLAAGSPTSSGQSASLQQNVAANNPNPDPIAYTALPVASPEMLAAGLAQVNPPLTIADGLGNQPWYMDTNLGNPSTQKNNFPVSFQVFIDQQGSYLTDTGVPTTGSPITVNLNCSIQQYNITMRHVANTEQTRTGYHITFWGMQADLISGSGSTGVMMNRFGLTDFYSLASVTTEAAAQVTRAYTMTNAGVDFQEVSTESGNPIVGTNPTLTAIQQQLQNQSGATQPLANLQNTLEPFRIQAEDAFQEFLALFKMNATTWLHSSGYGFDAENQPLQVPNQNQTSVFSQQVGASSTMIQARNNDVYKRGYVVMRFRNSQYLGYFKSLSFTMDATKPYQWHFNFVFQVERTLTLVYYPGFSASQSVVSSNSIQPPVITAPPFSGSVIPGGVPTPVIANPGG